MIEALACGTPVVALENGAVKEVIRNGVTGFIAKNEDEFIEVAKKAKTQQGTNVEWKLKAGSIFRSWRQNMRKCIICC